MPTSRQELKTYIPTKLAALLSSSFDPGDGNIYFGENRRQRRADREVFLKWLGEEFESKRCGRLKTLSMSIELYQRMRDRISKASFQEDIETAAKIVIEGLDNNITDFYDNITRPVEQVLCYETSSVVVDRDMREGAIEASQLIMLDVSVWES